jgi:hypothetical protein
MRIRTVSAHGMWRVASGHRDPFLHRRRIDWDAVKGWTAIITAGGIVGILLSVWLGGL